MREVICRVSNSPVLHTNILLSSLLYTVAVVMPDKKKLGREILWIENSSLLNCLLQKDLRNFPVELQK